MPAAPDDLPRSSSGRVPQWVLDEAAGRPPAATAWRTDVTPPAQRRTAHVPGSSRTAAWVGHPPPDGWRTPDGPSWERRPRPLRRRGLRTASRSWWLPVLLLVVLVGGRWAAVHPDRVGAAWSALTGADAGLVGGAGTGLPVGADDLGAADPAATSPDGTYAFLSVQTLPDGSVVPLTWSSCGQVRYTVSATDAPPGFRERVAEVAQELSDATGLRFLDVDTWTLISPAAPALRVEPLTPGWTGPVVIGFTDAASESVLEGDVVGMASTSAAMDPVSGRSYLTTGTVHLDVDLLTYGDFSGEPAYVATLRHEMGHLVGLDHVGDESQLMTPVAAGVHTFQPGDLAGLALLGAGGCAAGL